MITVVSTTDPTAVGSALVTVVAGAPAQFTVNASSTTIGTNQQITVTAQLADAYNNPVATSGLTVNWTATNGGSFSAGSSVTDINGMASVTFTTAGNTTTQVVTASANSPTVNGNSPTITVDETLSTELLDTVAFNVFPNPITNYRFNISLLEAIGNMIKVELYSVLGQQVFTLQKPSTQYTNEIELPQTLGKGVYFLRVSDGVSASTKKVVIK